MIIVRLLMQTVLLALAQIWANKFRALLTTLGIIIAVAAVITVVGATTGLRQYMLDQFASVGVNQVWIFPRRPPEMRDRFSWRDIRIDRQEVEGLKAAVPSLKQYSPVMQITQAVQYGDRAMPFVRVQGIWPSWHEIESRSVIAGRPFIEADEEERRNVCLVNDKAIDELGLPADPVGSFILLGGRRFMIVGVVETRVVSPMFGGSNDTQTEIFIPFATGETINPEPGIYIVGQLRGPELYEDVKAEAGAFLRRTRQLGPDDPDTFGIQAIDQFIEQFKAVAAGITAFLGGLVSIALLVGGIGIMNIMLVSVSERTREIGLRKAVGARPEVILLQFLVEAVTLCLLGCALGLAIGIGAVALMNLAPDSPVGKASAPTWAILVAVIFSAGTGVVFGMFPAIKAARLDPIDALRHE